MAQAGCQAADNSADSGVKRHRKPRKTKGWWWHGRQMTLLDLLMSFPFYFHAQGTPCCMELLLPISNECISWRNVYTMQSRLWFSDRNSGESSYCNFWKILLLFRPEFWPEKVDDNIFFNDLSKTLTLKITYFNLFPTAVFYCVTYNETMIGFWFL